MSKTKKCTKCGFEMDSSNKVCPSCGTKAGGRTGCSCATSVIGLLVFFFIVGTFSDSDNNNSVQPSNSDVDSSTAVESIMESTTTSSESTNSVSVKSEAETVTESSSTENSSQTVSKQGTVSKQEVSSKETVSKPKEVSSKDSESSSKVTSKRDSVNKSKNVSSTVSKEQTSSKKAESKADNKSSSKFTLDLSSNIYGDIDTTGLQLCFGDLLSVKNSGGGLVVVKAKIKPSYNNKSTIDQNYYSVCELIRENGFDACSELQYWAVADMTNGSEAKVISFTLDSDTIQKVKSGTIVENQLGNYVDDLYILPSLKN